MIKRKRRKNPRDDKLLQTISFEENHTGNIIQYIIKSNRKNIGYAIYNINDQVVNNIVIKHEFQKRGVGTYLYDHIEKTQNVILRPSNSLPGGKLLSGGQAFWENRLRKNPYDSEFINQLIIKKKQLKTGNIMYEALKYDDVDTDELIHIGYAEFNPTKQWINNVETDKYFKRKGVATYLYNYIEQDQNVKLKPSDSLFPESQRFWKNRLRKNPNPELEEFRLASIEDLMHDAPYIAKTIAKKLDSSRFDLYIVGSVLSPIKFNKNSDINFAVLVHDKRKSNGLDEENTDKLQKTFSKIPFSFGMLDISVHNNILRVDGDKMKIYEHI